MKITCTKEQKRMIVFAMAMSADCLFPANTVNCDEQRTCGQCISENVEWQIEDGDGDG